jgi:hypothetical protein
MKVSQKAIELLQQRLKNLEVSVETVELEQLANAIVAMSKLETMDDILALGAAKLAEISELGNKKLIEIDDSGNEKQTELLIERSKLMNFGDLPFIFGILSRGDDFYNGQYTDYEGGVLFGILTGCHERATTTVTGFYPEPKLCFLQGAPGNFIRRKHYAKYTYATYQYQCTCAALGCLFVKNTTESDIISTLTFGGSSCGSEYSSACVWVGVPNNATETIDWATVYSYTDPSLNVSSTASITVPAHSTVVVMLGTTPYFITAPTDSNSASYKYHAQFLHWRLHKVRSEFLVLAAQAFTHAEVALTLKIVLAYHAAGSEDTSVEAESACAAST